MTNYNSNEAAGYWCKLFFVVFLNLLLWPSCQQSVHLLHQPSAPSTRSVGIVFGAWRTVLRLRRGEERRVHVTIWYVQIRNISSMSVRFGRDNLVMSCVTFHQKHQSHKDKSVSHSLNAAQFGPGDHSGESRVGGGLIPVTPSTHGQWRRERRLGCPCWRRRRSWRWWRGRRSTTHVHWRRYDWRGHGKHSRVALKRRTWREFETSEDGRQSVGSACMLL